MAGRVSKKNESLVINSTNVFAALDTRKKKKKSSKSESSTKGGGSGSGLRNVDRKEADKEVFWAPKQLNVKSWADVDDEDDDDYFATTVPVWGPSNAAVAEEAKEDEESESEVEGLEDADDADDEEHEHEHEPEEAPVEKELVTKRAPEVSQPPKDPERQLSKKELKKKGLEELDAVLAELGCLRTESNAQDESAGTAKVKKSDNHDGDVGKNGNATGESKNAKKKKKKEKSSQQSKDSQDQQKGKDESVETEKSEDTPAVDVKERLKRAATRKKKTGKGMDAGARAAASEAAARSARLAAAKKKEKSHYSQQPVR